MFDQDKTRKPTGALALTFAALGVCACALSPMSACSTVEGAGEDIEYLGDSISDQSEEVQDD